MTDNTKAAYNFPAVVGQFKIKGRIAHIKPYGSGHIHDTFRLINDRPEFPDYILQRINHHVFTDIPALTSNIEKVTKHLREKLGTVPGADPDKEVLTLIPSQQEKGYYKDEAGNFWRMYFFLKDTRSYDMVATKRQAYESGKAFGKFQALLADLDAKSLHETIPNFHDVEDRLRLFQKAVQRNPKNRLKDVAPELGFVNQRADDMSLICRMGRRGEISLRITHNDTKFNNVLFNNKDQAQCVIDLDTVMPGYIAYDFGDAIRTIINKAAEDEKDLTKITLEMDLMESFTQGFLEETGSLLSDNELKSLSHAILLLPFVMGLRFLTDYIDGDHYYKIQFPDHNIQRARAQFKLVEKLEEQHSLITDLIYKKAESTNAVGNE